MIDRAIYALMAAIGIVLGSLVVQIWTTYSSAASPATYNPTLIPTIYGPTPTIVTVTPTVTPTPGALERAAAQMPLLERSWDARDWRMAIDHLNQIASMDSDYPGLARARCDTYLHWAQDMEKQCQIRQAYTLYYQASSICQDRDTVLAKRGLALRYLSGKWRYDHNRWSQAAAVLHTVYETDPDYAAGCTGPSTIAGDDPAAQPWDTRSLLYASYLAASRELLEQELVQKAHKAAEAALKLAPDSQEAAQLLDEIRSRPTPTPTPLSAAGTVGPADKPGPEDKRIEISISRQRMYVWQGEKLLYDWVCSTGGPGSGTAVGRYQVQTKVAEAWGSQWSLRMPYWLGIYTVGSLENGIHALPILSNGQTLWAGYLGTPVSYGCIILSTENARTLYQWADIGTAVWIDY